MNINDANEKALHELLLSWPLPNSYLSYRLLYNGRSFCNGRRRKTKESKEREKSSRYSRMLLP